MKVKLFALMGLVMTTLQGCTPSATTPSLPPIQTAPTESRAQAAIGNSQIFDQEMSAESQLTKSQSAGQ